MNKLLLTLLACGLAFAPIAPAADTFPAGVVFGPKAAFRIRAPVGWVLDNKAGVQQGFHCVLYPRGSTWADAEVVMYAKIASTTVIERDKFIEDAIEFYRKSDPDLKTRRVEEGKTEGGYGYVINEYRHGEVKGGGNSRFERVAYVQLPEAVAYVVLTCPTEELLAKYAGTIKEVMISFTYKPEFIDFGAKAKAIEKSKPAPEPKTAPAPKKPKKPAK
jgi:hypothetical protein